MRPKMGILVLKRNNLIFTKFHKKAQPWGCAEALRTMPLQRIVLAGLYPVFEEGRDGVALTPG